MNTMMFLKTNPIKQAKNMFYYPNIYYMTPTNITFLAQQNATQPER